MLLETFHISKLKVLVSILEIIFQLLSTANVKLVKSQQKSLHIERQGAREGKSNDRTWLE